MRARPTDLAAAISLAGPYRAGGTEFSRDGGRHDDVVDLQDLPMMRGVEVTDGGLVLGALTPLAHLERDSGVRAIYPALIEAVVEIANPALRVLATVGGSLLQRPRCDHGGAADCPTRRARQDRAVYFDDGAGCAAPHPSTLASAP